MSNNKTLITAGGRIECAQCQAMAKSTQMQCRRPATSGKRVCKLHGGKSTGPQTEQGRLRCAAAKTVHGKETRRKREEIRAALVKIAVLEELGRSIGLIVGPRSRGRKPSSYKFNSSS